MSPILRATSPRLGVAVAAAAALALLFCTTGCKGESVDPEEKGLGIPETEEHSKNPIKGSARCELNEKVSSPEEGTPEWVLLDIYKAAADKDGDASFGRFYAHFPSSKDKKFVKRQYWDRLRQHVGKYLEGEGDDASITLCKRDVLKNDARIKIFVRSNDQAKSNPPITLSKNEDKWQVYAFTY